MKTKISVYGNLILDFVSENFLYDLDESNAIFVSVGAAGNVSRQLSRLGRKDTFVYGYVGDDVFGETIKKQFPHLATIERSTSTANIFVNNNEKNVSVNWGACTEFNKLFKLPDSNWVHLMYLNMLPNLQFEELTKFKYNFQDCILSTDLCAAKGIYFNKSDIKSKLSLFDYVFISDDEAKLLYGEKEELKEYVENLKIHTSSNSKIILHHSKGSISWCQETKKYFNYDLKQEQQLNSVNVLGAGDTFAASVIHYITTDKSFEEAISLAHQETYNFLNE